MQTAHIHGCVGGFSGRHNVREDDTIDQMREMVARIEGRFLPYRFPEKDNGLSGGQERDKSRKYRQRGRREEGIVLLGVQ